MKKYEFTGEVKWWFGHTLHQIRALVAFGAVDAGEIGGWIEREENLAHDGNAWVYGNALVSGDARVSGDALVYGNAWVYGNARVSGNAQVCNQDHWLCIGPIGSRDDFTTFFREASGQIAVKCGCFYGNIDAFADKVLSTHGDTPHAKVYMTAIELAKARINLSEEGGVSDAGA